MCVYVYQSETDHERLARVVKAKIGIRYNAQDPKRHLAQRARPVLYLRALGKVLVAIV